MTGIHRALVIAAGVTLASACGFDAPGRAPLLELNQLEAPSASGAGEPSLAVGPRGEVYLTWLEPLAGAPTGAASTREGAFALRMAVLEPGGTWSAPGTIASGTDFFVNWADFPILHALPDGSLAAHWLRLTGRGTRYDIHLARSPDGGVSWTDPVVPHRDGTVAEHGFVSYFPGAAGQLGLAWLDGRKYAASNAGDHDLGSEMTLRMTTVGPDMTLGREILLDDRVCDCCQTAAAVTDDGPVIVYRDRSPDEVRDISIIRHAAGEWSAPVPVHEDGWVIPACPVNGPSVSALARRVAVAWYTAAQDTGRVRLAFSDDAGASFGPAVRIDDGDPVGRVAVELLPDGDALVTWLERIGEGAELRIRRVAGNGTIGPVMTIASSSAERASGFPRMARSGDQLVFAWTEAGQPAQVRTAVARVPGL